jgi:hypothetical protein
VSIFPMPWQPKRIQPSARPTPQPSPEERLQEAERRCVAAERELERVTRQSDDEANAAASAIARLSADLDKERARANEFEQIMGAMGQEFATLNAIATTLAERAGVAPAELAELKGMWAKDRADPDHAAVGLHQSAPDFLVRAARTAFRKAHHPDTRPQSEKAAAEEMFKRNEAAFARLFEMRGRSS